MYMLHMILCYTYIFFVCSNYLANYFLSRGPINCANKLEKGARTWNALREISGKMSDRPEVTQAAKS